jgi:sporulation protein YlmC with PRC-barrel domain
MKRKLRSTMIGTVSLLFFLFVAVPFAMGQQQRDTQPQQQQTEQQRHQQPTGQQRGESELIAANHLSMSKLMGKNVKGPQGEDLGSIEDVIVGQDGRIQHIIVSHGGVMGIGARKSAIPWEAAQLRVEGDDQVMTSISKERLENAPSFTGDEYPGFADRQYDQQLRSYYGVEQQDGHGMRPTQEQPQQPQQQPEQAPGQQQQTPGQPPQGQQQ